jgi:hypothetical protein
MHTICFLAYFSAHRCFPRSPFSSDFTTKILYSFPIFFTQFSSQRGFPRSPILLSFHDENFVLIFSHMHATRLSHPRSHYCYNYFEDNYVISPSSCRFDCLWVKHSAQNSLLKHLQSIDYSPPFEMNFHFYIKQYALQLYLTHRCFEVKSSKTMQSTCDTTA